MGMIVDYVCMNCFFIGTTADRGTRCCDKPDPMLIKGYHAVRKTAARKGHSFEVNPDIQKYFSTALEESRYKGGEDVGQSDDAVSAGDESPDSVRARGDGEAPGDSGLSGGRDGNDDVGGSDSGGAGPEEPPIQH